MARDNSRASVNRCIIFCSLSGKNSCGADISRRVIELSEGRIRIGPGTLYTLSRPV